LIEIMLGTSIMVIVLVALLGSFFGQSTLNLNSRNMMAAMNDATRIMEEIRRQNTISLAGSSCAQSNIPSARPPSQQSWNAWFDLQSPGKSIQPQVPSGWDSRRYELVVVTCQEAGDQDGDPIADEYCGQNQVGLSEWYPWYAGGIPSKGLQTNNTTFDPIRVTVAVGWNLRQPIGNTGGINAGSEFTYRRDLGGKGTVSSDQLRVGPDANNNRVIDSPAMLTTLVTCR